MMKKWEELKKQGSTHYKTDGGVEPIDLYAAGGMFKHFALCSIIKYAFRARVHTNIKDLHKIIDYAQKLIAYEEIKDGKLQDSSGSKGRA